MPRDTNLGARVRARKVKQVTTIQVDDPAVLRFDVELTEEYSAEVLVPRSLIGQLDGVVQGDELAVLVWLTAGAPQVQGRRVGTTWAQVFGLGTTLEVLQKLREMSPELQLNDHQLDYVCRKIDDSRSGHSAGRARIVGGVRWTPKRLACEQVDVAVVPSDLSGSEAVAAMNKVLQDSAGRRAALLPSNRAFGKAERLISMSTPRQRVIIGACELKTVPLALLKGIQEKEVYGSAGLAHRDSNPSASRLRPRNYTCNRFPRSCDESHSPRPQKHLSARWPDWPLQLWFSVAANRSQPFH